MAEVLAKLKRIRCLVCLTIVNYVERMYVNVNVKVNANVAGSALGGMSQIERGDGL